MEAAQAKAENEVEGNKSIAQLLCGTKRKIKMKKKMRKALKPSAL
jgi:hypothetical protein